MGEERANRPREHNEFGIYTSAWVIRTGTTGGHEVENENLLIFYELLLVL